jgi:chaperone BCS1
MGDNLNGQDMAAQLGLLNIMRTGDPILDVLVCMILPVIIKLAFDGVGQCRPMLTELINKLRQKYVGYERLVAYEERVNMYGESVEGNGHNRNNILQKAMLHYVATLKIDYRMARTNLMAIKEKGTYDTNQYEMVYGSTAEQLKAYDVIPAPPLSEWVSVEPGVELMIEEDCEDSGGEGKKPNGGEDKSKKINVNSITYRVRSSDLLNGAHKVDGFIEKAYKHYIAEMAKLADSSRYLYMLDSASESGGNDGGRDAGVRHYKRYRLSGHKKFSSLFFQGKEPLLQQLNHFLDKSGKYQVDGFPHKLGVLLYGPPGTGKTSLIKAIAEATGRNVVSIPLARIKTNQELMDIVYDQRFKVKDEDMPIKLQFKDVIYVFEDIDCASKVVHRRVEKKDEPVKETIEITKRVTVEDDDPDGGAIHASELGAPRPLMRGVSTASTGGTRSSTTTVTRQVSGGGEGKSVGGAAKTKTAGDVVASASEYEDNDDDEDGDDDKDMRLAKLVSLMSGVADANTPANASGGGGASMKLKMSSKTDRLDLAGVLNVLDGVVDCPGRLLIMTTNHPEKLDPALIRPGRIDRKLKLGYMDAENVIKMVEHCFSPFMDDEKLGRDGLGNVLKADEKDVIRQLFSDPNVKRTPAQIEQLCAEHDDVESFLHALQDDSGKAEEF